MIAIWNYDDVKFFLMGRTYLGKPLYTTGVYYVDGLLIDSGPANMKLEFSEVYKHLQIEQLINTHFHEDHVGNNRAIAHTFNIIPKMRPEGFPKVTVRQSGLDFYRRLTWGIPEASKAEAVGEKVRTDNFEFEVIYTPGHSSDHICLFEHSRGWLFSGDLYLGSKMRLLEKDENIYGIISSLKKVSGLPVKTIFCSHRGRLEKGRELILKKISNLEKLFEKVLSMHDKGMEEKEITQRLFPKDTNWRLFTGGHLTSRNLVSAIIKQR